MTFAQGERIRQLASSPANPLCWSLTRIIPPITHGNPGLPAYSDLDETTLHHLHALDLIVGRFGSGPASNVMVEGTRDVLVGNKTLKVVSRAPNTDSDLVVLFVEDKTCTPAICSSIIFIPASISRPAARSTWPSTLDIVLTLPFEHVIPGHGALSDVAGLKQFREFMRQLAAVGANAKVTGASVDATLRDANITADANYGRS
jgi:hypothetical protein